MVERPLEDKRPLGPLFGTSGARSDDSSDNSGVPSTVDEDELAEFKDNVEEAARVRITMEEAYAIKQIDTPMLQSYVSNTLREVARQTDDATVQGVLESEAAERYARKLGSVQELQQARSVFS